MRLPCIDWTTISGEHIAKEAGDSQLVEASCIGNPKLDATGDISIGAVDIQQARIIGAQPDQLGDIGVVRQQRNLATIQIDQVPA